MTRLMSPKTATKPRKPRAPTVLSTLRKEYAQKRQKLRQQLRVVDRDFRSLSGKKKAKKPSAGSALSKNLDKFLLQQDLAARKVPF